MKLVLVMLSVFVVGVVLGSYLGLNSQYVPSLFSTHSSLPLPNTQIEHKGDMRESSSEKEPLYWVAPMDKNYRRDQPGLSPMGMELVPVYAEEMKGDTNIVTISASVENNLGVKTQAVSKSRLFQPIKAFGTVQFDESNILHVHSRVEGWIEALNISAVGDRVQKGQILFEIYSPELVNAQEEYLAALRSENKNLIRASSARLMSLGVEKNQIIRLKKTRTVDQRIKVIAAEEGVVTKMMVRQGMFVKPMTEILSIGTLDQVWVISEVFEHQASIVKQGQEAEIQFNAFPGRHWQGTIDYIYPELNATTRTVQARISLENPHQQLKPNMLANVSIHVYAADESINVPVQALIKGKHHQRIVKSLGEGKFQSIIVKSGLTGIDEVTAQEKIQIIDGLNVGDKVVTSAQFLIDSESNIDAELLRIGAGTSKPSIDHSKMDHSDMNPDNTDHGAAHAHH